MYIEPFVLFVAGELVFVYIVIASFLFYNGRLHNILRDMLKEMRRNRMLRELLNAKRLAGERSSASKAISQDLMKAIERGGPDVYTNFVEVKLDTVTEQAQELGLTGTPEFDPNDPAQLQILALRTALLNLEKMFEQSKGIPDEEAAQNILESFDQEILSKLGMSTAQADPKKIKQLRAQAEFFKNRASEAEKFEPLYYSSQQELRDVLEELESLKTISLDTIPNMAEEPKMGDYADEIYQLKSQKFDMLETINKLKLELEQSNAADNPLDFIETQEKQIEEQARYIKESDVCITLLEKELETVTHQLLQEQARLKALEAKQSKKITSNVTKEDIGLNKDTTNQLSTVTKNQQAMIEELKAELEKLKAIEGAAEIAEKQQNQLNQLERNIQESETCIEILESELESASDNISELITSLRTSEALNESGDELEGMLKKFVQDSKDMLKNMARLEQENERLVSVSSKKSAETPANEELGIPTLSTD